MMVRIHSILALTAILPLLAFADEVYRTVDESGQVIFSDIPPETDTTVDVIELMPGPSEQAKRDAEMRNRAIQSSLETMQKQREQKERTRAARVKEAESALQRAEAELVSAKEIRDTDRQTVVGGKNTLRKIRPEYFERVRDAEAAVEAARESLRKARSGH